MLPPTLIGLLEAPTGLGMVDTLWNFLETYLFTQQAVGMCRLMKLLHHLYLQIR